MNNLDCTFLVIGSGIAGIYTTYLLSKKFPNKKIILVERGPQHGQRHYIEGEDFKILNSNYNSASNGRIQAFGGTSLIWGGAMQLVPSSDLKPHSLSWHNGFHIKDRGGAENSIENFCDLLTPKHIKLNNQKLDVGYFERYRARWPNFKNRNFANLFNKKLKHRPNLKFLFESNLISIGTRSNSVSSATIISNYKKEVKIDFEQIILCSGTIENTRLLLNFDRYCFRGLNLYGKGLGKYLNDHISLPIAKIKPKSFPNFSKKFGIHIYRTGLLSDRWVLSHKERVNSQLPGCMLHLMPDNDLEVEFRLLRSLLQDVQSKQVTSLKNLLSLSTSLPWLLKVAYYRYFQNRVYFGSLGQLLNLVIEQKPSPKNYIDLSIEKDQFGLHKSAISWDIGEEDVSNFLRSIDHLGKKLFELFGNHAIVQPFKISPEILTTKLKEQGGIHHPCGTISSGKDRRRFILNEQWKLHGIKNMHVFCTGCFQTPSSVNPTMTLMAKIRDNIMDMS